MLTSKRILLHKTQKGSKYTDSNNNVAFSKFIITNLTSERNLVAAPVSADSANSHQGCFSRVQKANGMAMQGKKGNIITIPLHK